MYDYATTYYQQQEITQIQQTNTKIDTLNNKINDLTATIEKNCTILAIIIMIMIIKELVLKCLGGK